MRLTRKEKEVVRTFEAFVILRAMLENGDAAAALINKTADNFKQILAAVAAEKGGS